MLEPEIIKTVCVASLVGLLDLKPGKRRSGLKLQKPIPTTESVNILHNYSYNRDLLPTGHTQFHIDSALANSISRESRSK